MFWACFRPIAACCGPLELLANIAILGCLPFSASFLEKSVYTLKLTESCYLTSFWLCPITTCRASVCSGLVLGRLLHVRSPLELLANIGLLGCLPFSALFLEKSVYTETD